MDSFDLIFMLIMCFITNLLSVCVILKVLLPEIRENKDKLNK
jgi:hypothetical protein